jgi:hypothetical protein
MMVITTERWDWSGWDALLSDQSGYRYHILCCDVVLINAKPSQSITPAPAHSRNLSGTGFNTIHGWALLVMYVVECLLTLQKLQSRMDHCLLVWLHKQVKHKEHRWLIQGAASETVAYSQISHVCVTFTSV